MTDGPPVELPAPGARGSRARRAHRGWALLALVSAGALLVAGSSLLGFGPAAAGEAAPRAAAQSGETVPSGFVAVPAAPSAAPVDDAITWWRAPSGRTIPARLDIPALGVAAAVQAVGLTPEGALDLPESPSVVGWFAGGPRPGDAQGSAVLAGHLDSPAGELGPLARLVELAPGAELVVTDATGASTVFVVERLATVERDQLHLAAPFRTTGRGVLTLITCTGPFDRAARVYPQNLLVTAVAQS